MNLVTDEDVWAPLVSALRQAGHVVYSIQELHPGLPDPDVLRLAFERDELLLTRDRDHGEQVFVNEFRTAGVMFLRLHKVPELLRNDVVLDALKEHGTDLKRKFTVVSLNNVRIRDIEHLG